MTVPDDIFDKSQVKMDRCGRGGCLSKIMLVESSLLTASAGLRRTANGRVSCQDNARARGVSELVGRADNEEGEGGREGGREAE